MSQAKVDRYKKEKANRKKTIARNKLKARIAAVFTGVVVIGLAGWAGYAVYENYEEKRPAETFYCDTTAIDDYLSSVTGN